jgi:hypothetical protein
MANVQYFNVILNKLVILILSLDRRCFLKISIKERGQGILSSVPQYNQLDLFFFFFFKFSKIFLSPCLLVLLMDNGNAVSPDTDELNVSRIHSMFFYW